MGGSLPPGRAAAVGCASSAVPGCSGCRFSEGQGLLGAVRIFDGWIRTTPVDLRHDSTDESAEETAA
ncbi:MAG: hypothetical protein ABJA34_01535, partial [Pseudonocardiales bacterium]